MSGQQIGTVIGGVVGAYFGGPAGAQLGMAIGGTIGGAVDPTKINGPHIGDGQTQTATDGAPIAWVMGTATVAGTIVQVSPRREVKIKDSGKGGPVVSHYEARQDFAILVCESSEIRGSTINSILMVQQDGKIVYDVRPGSKILADSAKWKANVDFLFGDEAQLPHPTLEAITGVGNTPAYRGSCVAVFKDFNITAAGGRIPTFQFTVQSLAGGIDVSDFHVGTYLPAGATLVGTALQNTTFDIGNTTVWQLPVPASAYRVTADFTIIAGGGGDPMAVALADSGLRHLMDFMPITENQIDIKQRPAVNYFASDFYADSRYVTGSELSVGVPYHIDLTLSGSTYSYVLSSGGSILGSGTANKMPGGSPANLTFSRTGNIFEAAVVRYTHAQVFTETVPTLAEIVTKICKRGGLTDADIDVADLASTLVQGYPIAAQCSAADALAPLLQAYFAYASEYDGKIHFKFYGADAATTVAAGDLIEDGAANGSAITKTVRNQATEFPRKVTATYYDPAQNYMPIAVSAGRSAAGVIATGETTMQIPVVMDATTAQQAVDKALKVAYATLEGTQDYSVPFARSATYLSVCAGEAILMDGKRWVVYEVSMGDGVLKWSTRYDRQSAYTSTVQAIPGLPPADPLSPYSGPTTLIPMNLPALRPQDTYGLYLAAASATGSPSWKGCTVQMSLDGQVSWQNATTISVGSTLGTVTAAEPTGGEPLTVDTGGTGDLETVTPAQLAANANAFALVNGSTAEIAQFETATLDSGTQYELTNISRGLLGTTDVPATAGQQFTMLDSVYFLPIDTAFAGKTIALRAVGFGEVAEDATVVTITYNPDTTTVHDGGTVT